MGQNSELAAKRWAKALMELALEDNEISKEDILRDLRDVGNNIESSEELKNVINNPSITAHEKQVVLSKLFQDKLIPVVYNFIFVLNLRKRINIINEIADAFEKELEDYNNKVRVNITSAIEIDDEKKQSIKDKISEKLKKEVIVDWGIDTDIIAGLIFNINDTVIDNSVKNKLDTLSNMIIKA